jgi:sugar O-acyltransferase (sialic acid O-acetyltransferase NeuD family)
MALIIVAGASGQHAAVVYEAAVLSGLAVLGFATIDGSPDLLLDCDALGPLATLLSSGNIDGHQCIVACGDNALRMRLTEQLAAQGASLASVRHPAAIVSPSSRIGPGSAILAGAIVGPRATLGKGVIMNHAASVDHDCRVEDFVNLSPGARLGGGVHVGPAVFLGLNAAILPGIRLGERAIVGAGATVTRDIAPGSTVVGVPARAIGE